MANRQTYRPNIGDRREVWLAMAHRCGAELHREDIRARWVFDPCGPFVDEVFAEYIAGERFARQWLNRWGP